MATSDEPPPAGLAGGLSRGAWGSQSFDVVRRSPAAPFWNSAPPPPQSSSFLDLNAPFEEDPQPVSRGLSNFMDHLGSAGPVEGTISFLNPAKDSGGDGLRSFMDASGSSRNLNHDGDEASAVRDQEPQGQDTGPFVDYLSQFSGKKEGDFPEKERSKPVAREVSDFPDELLSLSSSYHKKRGEAGRTGRPPADGAALFLASGRAQDSPHLAVPDSRNAKEPRPAPMGVNFGSHRLDDISSFREVEKMSHGGEALPGAGPIEERSLFPRNAAHIERNDSFYSMPNIVRDERAMLLPTGSARETLELSNNLSFKEEKFGMSRQTRVGVESYKEGMSLSLKRPFEEADATEEYKRRREEESLHASLYSRQGEGRDGGDENSDVVEVSHMKRRRDRPGGEEQRFQNDHKRVQNDQSASDDKSIVWPPVVIIENTRLSWDDEKKKWKGLASSDIQKSLKNVENWEYAKVKPLFDMHGQKSSALVIFPATFEGYFEAEALNEQLERSGKGKDQWMKVRPQDPNPRSPRGFNTPDLISQDGKRILYGYLAQPEDIQRADPHKSGLKWFIESFNEKVRKPAQQRHQEKELHKVTYMMLEAEARRQMESLESDKNEVQNLMQQVQECTKKLEVDKEREQAERQKYEQDLVRRMKKNEEEEQVQREQFHQREQEIRTTLEEYKQVLLHERQQKALQANAVRHGIHQTIKQHEAKLAEESHLEALEEMKLEAELRAEMESKLFDLERKRQVEEKEMQDRQQEQLKELKKVNLKDKEDLLQQTIQQQEALMKEMEDAVRETQALKHKLQEEDYGRECVICLDEFGHEPSRQRAHYRDCNHANICFSCAMNLWKQKNRKCPYCNTPAKLKPGRLPAKIFF